MSEKSMLQRAFEVYSAGEEMFILWCEQLSEQDYERLELQIGEAREKFLSVFDVWMYHVFDWVEEVAVALAGSLDSCGFSEGDTDEEEL